MSDKVKPMDNSQMGEGKAAHPDAEKDSHRLDINKDQLANGPVVNRGCTDIICCFLFLAFLVGMAGTSAYGFLNGDPQLLLTGWDYDRNGCGYNTTTKDFPYLYFPAPDISAISSDYYQAFKYSMCVKSCPSSNSSEAVQCKEPSFFNSNVKFKNCTYYPSAYTSGSVTYYGDPFRYGSVKILGKFCIPDSEAIKKEAIKQFKDTFYEKYNVDKFSDYVMDLINCWQVMLICFGAAFIFGMIYLVLLRCFAGLLVWTTIFGILGSLGGGGYWLYHMRNNYDETDNNFKYLQYGAYALWGLAGLFFLIVLCCCSRIRLAVAIMKVTSQFVYNTPSILLLPIIFLIICAGWIVFWVFTAIYVFSVGNIEPRESPFSFVSTIKWTTQTRYIFLYHLFGGLWVNAFLIGCFQFIVAAACAIWYFSFSTDVAGKGSMRTGAKWILRYHFGSIAFGSFIIALVQFIRIIFEYYRKKIQAANKNNPVVKCLLCCTSYLLACLERCVKFITKNAYIQVAITGKNFCRSAWNGFLLVVRNVFRFGAVHTLGAIFMFLGRLFIICLTVIACFIQVEYWPYFSEKLSSPYFPCIVAGIIGFLVGGIFVSIFSFASDTVLQCFFLDEEMGDDAKGRPPNNRPPLMNSFVTLTENSTGKKGCCRCCC